MAAHPVVEDLDPTARRLWAEVLAALEAALGVPRGHVGCGGILKANGRAARRIVTLAGEVAIRRRRYRCGACGAELVPLDEALGLEPRVQHTPGVRERALWLVTELSYAKTARTLDELRGLAVSHGQLHRWVADEGARIEDDIAARQEAVFGAHPERTRSMPPKTMGRERRRLLDRHYVGGTGSWTTFAERLTALCAELGVFEARRILFISDGALSIRWIRERSFPDAVELLDWYHLVEQLRSGVGRAHGEVLSTSSSPAASRPGA